MHNQATQEPSLRSAAHRRGPAAAASSRASDWRLTGEGELGSAPRPHSPGPPAALRGGGGRPRAPPTLTPYPLERARSRAASGRGPAQPRRQLGAAVLGKWRGGAGCSGPALCSRQPGFLGTGPRGAREAKPMGAGQPAAPPSRARPPAGASALLRRSCLTQMESESERLVARPRVFCESTRRGWSRQGRGAEPEP